MLKTITKKCPCGYTYQEQLELDLLTIPTTGLVTRIPGRSPKIHNMPIQKEEVVKRSVLVGNDDFQAVLLDEEKGFDFIVCPKCGTLLLSQIAIKIESEEEKN